MGSTNKVPSKRTLARSTKKTRVEVPLPEKDAELAANLPETDGWLTRNEATSLLRCSPQTLKNYEERGLLHPRHALRRDGKGADRTLIVYNPKELSGLPVRTGGGQPRIEVREPGEQAARAFELFRKGCDLDEVVIELRETPERIDQLHDHWLEQTKARYVINPEAKKLLEQMLGEFKSVTEMVELIAGKLSPA